MISDTLSLTSAEPTQEHTMQDLSVKLNLLTESKESIESTSDLISKKVAAEPEGIKQICEMWAGKMLEAKESNR